MTSSDLAVRAEPFRLLRELEESGALTPVGLRLSSDISYDRFEALLALLGSMHSAVRFAIGDALAFGEDFFEDRVYQAAEALGSSEGSRMDYLRVARKVPIENRRVELTWRHHRAVATLGEETQEEMLTRAVEEQLSTRDLEALLRDLSATDADSRRAPTESPPLLDQLAPDEEEAVRLYRDAREERGQEAASEALRAALTPSGGPVRVSTSPVARCPSCGRVLEEED